MKRLFLLALTAITLTTASASDSLTVRIKGMRCGECAHKVKTILRKDAGVGSVKFNIERRTATIAYDKSKTCADSIYAHLAATGRYKAIAYDPSEVIRKGMGLRMDDMHCENCANRIIACLSKMEGVDSLAPHIDQHRFFIRYDANRTSKDEIVAALVKTGFTPVNFYTDKRIEYAYYIIPEAAATQETVDNILAIEGVDDANVNAKRKSLAVTYLNTKLTAEQLLEQIQKAGIQAALPTPHVCSEDKK